MCIPTRLCEWERKRQSEPLWLARLNFQDVTVSRFYSYPLAVLPHHPDSWTLDYLRAQSWDLFTFLSTFTSFICCRIWNTTSTANSRPCLFHEHEAYGSTCPCHVYTWMSKRLLTFNKSRSQFLIPPSSPTSKSAHLQYSLSQLMAAVPFLGKRKHLRVTLHSVLPLPLTPHPRAGELHPTSQVDVSCFCKQRSSGT